MLFVETDAWHYSVLSIYAQFDMRVKAPLFPQRFLPRNSRTDVPFHSSKSRYQEKSPVSTTNRLETCCFISDTGKSHFRRLRFQWGHFRTHTLWKSLHMIRSFLFLVAIVESSCLAAERTNLNAQSHVAPAATNPATKSYETTLATNTNETSRLFQRFNIPSFQSEYSLAPGNMGKLAKALNGKHDSEPFATYSLVTTNPSGLLHLTIRTTTGNDHDDFSVTMTADGDVRSESYCRTLVKSGIVHTSEVSLTTITLRKDEFLGLQKVVSFEPLITPNAISPSQSANKEWLLDKEDITTTLLQLPVYIASIASLPPQGLDVRWILKGNPIAVRLIPGPASTIPYAMQVFKVTRYNNTLDAEPLAVFEYSSRPTSFCLPDRIILSKVSPLSLVKTRDNVSPKTHTKTRN